MTRVSGIPTSRAANFIKFQRDPLGFLVDALPMGDVVSLRTSSFRPTFVVNSPDFIQEILVHQEQHFRKGRSSGVLRRTIGDGLLTSEHSVHRQQKKYLTPVFYKERIQTYAQIVQEETERLADSLEDGVPVPMHEVMMQLTLGIIARSLFKTELDADKAELAAAVDVTIRQTAGTIFSPIIIPFAIPTPGNVKHKRAIRTLEAMIYEAISKGKRDPDAYADSMLGLLLDTKDESGNALSDQEIRDQMMTMLLAGHETTANALVWAWYCLERAPGARQRLHEELDVIRLNEESSGGERLSAYDRYREMSFTKQIVQETLRLYPPAWAILRESEQELVMLGDHFPKNSSFLISPYAIHRNDSVFGDAGVFRPERFDGGVSQWARFAYFPFGGGSRGCIGSQFALLEAGIIMGSLAEKFHFTSTSGQGEAEPEPLVSLRVKNGRWMVPERRQNQKSSEKMKSQSLE
ncbi:cytochrome P450 [Cohnella silvisoli]|uniref:Cytochrome P450 n=1 Tax=Cohnella silvisoli TaxID=2873699 RepID=A0ABV1KMR8_9BACL|nr:cytochrome P450 [Cohnella silvisoli]MCD9020293.1 cytochrome P450 [Cohnella silvisoli]